MLHVHLIAHDAIENAENTNSSAVKSEWKTSLVFAIDFSFIFQSQITQELCNLCQTPIIGWKTAFFVLIVNFKNVTQLSGSTS